MLVCFVLHVSRGIRVSQRKTFVMEQQLDELPDSGDLVAIQHGGRESHSGFVSFVEHIIDTEDTSKDNTYRVHLKNVAAKSDVEFNEKIMQLLGGSWEERQGSW